jgi:cyclopropane-fatty-acyl-phospholipid synthase
MVDTLLEKDALPDWLIRIGIRRLLRQRLREEKKENCELQQEHLMSLVDELKSSPIALNTKHANEQHYELPTEFFRLVLGRHMKYSSGYWREGVSDLDQSESDMLSLTCQRAQIAEGMNILELGCGWGSLSLFMAERFAKSRIIGISNSRTQKIFIEGECKKRDIRNLEIITADMNSFTTKKRFDRVVSVEMFEHMRNYEKLLAKIAGFLHPKGKLFVHIFTHKEFAYKFEVRDASDWMSKYFFTGGIMPSDHLLFYFPGSFTVEDHWRVSGRHYQNTSEAWLRNMSRHKDELLPLLSRTYGESEALRWWTRWRVFFMACSELWGFNNGEEWLVSHYLFAKR